MQIAEVNLIGYRSPGVPPPKGVGNPLVTPMSIFLEGREHGHPSAPHPERLAALIVEVVSDDGKRGYGSVGGSGFDAAAVIIAKHLTPLILHENPLDTNLLWERMFRATTNFGRKGLALEAISAIDIALWDLKGKILNQPVYNLLGGRTRDRIQVYASRLYATEDLNALAAEAETYLQQGFRAMKLRFGYGPRDGMAGMEGNVALVRTVRETVGNTIDVAADVYMGWDVNYALRILPLLAPYRLAWIEEPVMPDDIEGYAHVKAAANALGILISGGEHEFSRYGMRELVDRNAVDILQPDVNRCGGITEAQRIWAHATAHNLQVTPHAGQSHNYHLIISHMNSPISEYFPEPSGIPDGNELFWAIFDGEPRVQDGYVVLSGKPGLGLELNPEFRQKYGVAL